MNSEEAIGCGCAGLGMLLWVMGSLLFLALQVYIVLFLLRYFGVI